MSTYKKAGIKVFLNTAKNVSDYKKVAGLDPFGVVVNDVAKFQTWRTDRHSMTSWLCQL
jgi:hypothetical protein